MTNLIMDKKFEVFNFEIKDIRIRGK